jgi:hypothetical protein
MATNVDAILDLDEAHLQSYLDSLSVDEVNEVRIALQKLPYRNNNKAKRISKMLTSRVKVDTAKTKNDTAYRTLRPFNANTMWKQFFGNIPNPPATKKDVRGILESLVSKKDDVYAEDMAEYVLQNLDEGGAWYNTLIGAKNGAK